LLCFLAQVVCMREEHNSVLSTPAEADTDISVTPKYRPIHRPGRYYRSISSCQQKMHPRITRSVVSQNTVYICSSTLENT